MCGFSCLRRILASAQTYLCCVNSMIVYRYTAQIEVCHAPDFKLKVVTLQCSNGYLYYN